MSEPRAGAWWMENLLRPVLLAAMLVCLAVPLTMLLEWSFRGWQGTYYLFVAFAAGLVGILSERLLQRARITGWGYLGSRASEFLIWAILLKLASYAPRGPAQLWFEVRRWPSQPETILTELDLITSALLLGLWAGALAVARRVRELDAADETAPPPPDRSSTEYYLWLTEPSDMRDREAALQWLGDSIVWGGIGMLAASAVLYLILPDQAVPVAATLLYFALGVALLSQARFSVSHASWQRMGVVVQRGLARRWLWWALLFLVGVALVALVLPTRYAMGPVMAIYNLLYLIARLVMLLYGFLVYALGWLLALLLPDRPQPEPPPLSLEEMLPPEEGAQEAGVMPPWITVILTALFWILIIGIAGFAVVRVLRERLGLLAEGEGAKGDLWSRFVALLRAVWRGWRSWRRDVQTGLARRLARSRSPELPLPGLPGFLALRRLPPKELVRFFYLSTARRAAEAGRPRQPGQTPYEYRTALDRSFPDLEPDLEGLTEAFVQARYSDRPVEKGDVEAVKPLWQRIKAALRRRRARPPGDRA